MQHLTEIIAAPEATPNSVLGALCHIVETQLELTLFTVMELDLDSGFGQRSYTNSPEAYPVGGAKPLLPNRWTVHVVDGQKTFYANSIDDLVDIFPDHELIRSLGCESCLNLPVVIGGRVLGTINCLGPAGHFTPERVTAAEALRPVAALALLSARHLRAHGAG